MTVVIVGTDTGVGKTWVTCSIAVELMKIGCSVVARKPVQSFDVDDSDATDAERLAETTHESPESVCPPIWSFPLPLAPPMAADVLGRPPIYLRDLSAWVTSSLKGSVSQLSLVELVGGVCSPQAHDGDGLDLIRLLNPSHIVLVAPSGLGCLNATRLSMRALSGIPSVPGIKPVVCLNRFNPENELHLRNQAWLRDQDGLETFTTVPQCLSKLALRLIMEDF